MTGSWGETDESYLLQNKRVARLLTISIEQEGKCVSFSVPLINYEHTRMVKDVYERTLKCDKCTAQSDKW